MFVSPSRHVQGGIQIRDVALSDRILLWKIIPRLVKKRGRVLKCGDNSGGGVLSSGLFCTFFFSVQPQGFSSLLVHADGPALSRL